LEASIKRGLQQNVNKINMNHTPHAHSDWKVIELNMVWRGTAAKMLWTHLTTLMTHTVLYKSTYHAGPHSTFCHSVNVKANVFLRACPRSWHKERASFVYNFLAIWLNESFWLAVTSRNSSLKNSESSEATAKLNVYSRKYNFNCSVTVKIQAELKSFWCKTYTLAFLKVQPWKKPFGKIKALEFEKKKALGDTVTRAAWRGLFCTTAS